jgi:hypothetical protein
MLHELIDPDEPKCLYCNQVILDSAMGLRSNNYSSTGYNPKIRSDAETLYCVDCKETFEIYSIQKEDGYTTYTGFSFTCKGYNIYNNYVEKYFDISDKNGKHITAIPEFSANFSSRKKLHEKLKTYILFS